MTLAETPQLEEYSLGYFIKTGNVFSPEPPLQVSESYYAQAVGATGNYYRTPKGSLRPYVPAAATRIVNGEIVLVATRAASPQEAAEKIAQLAARALEGKSKD